MSLCTPLHRSFPWIGALPILLAPLATAATVTYTFESNPTLAGQIAPDLDPGGTGFVASFGANAPNGTFSLMPPMDPFYLTMYPNARITTTALGETDPFGTDHSLVITSNLPFIAVELDWASYSIPTGGYLQVSDGLGKTQNYYDDGTMTFIFDDGFSTYVNGTAAGTAIFETSAPVTSITITAWDTADAPIPGTPVVQALMIDNVTFTVVPEPGTLSLSLLGVLALLKRSRSHAR
jgi:hypothetical protein